MTENNLTLTPSKVITIGSFQLKENGLEVTGEPSFDEWLEVGKFIRQAGKSVHFWIGDYLNYGELRWGDTYREVIEMTGFDIQTLRNDKWVASRVPPERRQLSLTFDHHQQVADILDEEEQEELLTKAVEQKMNREQFRKFISSQKLAQDPSRKKPSSQQEASLFEKALQSGKVFLQDMTKLAGSELSYDEYLLVDELVDEISSAAANIKHEEAYD